MAEVVSSCQAYYGRDYIGYTFKSVDDLVDRHFLWISDRPTYGYGLDAKNPETPEQLIEAAQSLDLTKPFHYEIGFYPWEKAHYDDITRFCGPETIVVVLDADEIANVPVMTREIEFMRSHNYARLRTKMIHMWKGFNWFCWDTQTQVRLRKIGGEGEVISGIAQLPENPAIYHFGYSRSIQDTQIKWQFSAHRDELRPEWFEDVFCSWTPEFYHSDGVHPVCKGGFWQPQPFDKYSLPDFMWSHPYFNLDIVS